MSGSEHGDAVARPANRALGLAENVVYTLAGLLLVAGAIAVLGSIVHGLVRHIGDGVQDAATDALDGLLLVFILLELLAALRVTMVEHKLVAEPFLVAGIIAAIKEIILASLDAKGTRGGEQGQFSDAMVEIGVLGGVVLLLAVAAYLVRRKEREPEEEREEEVEATTTG